MILFPHEKLQQGSTDWLKLRTGRPTASEFDSILTPAKGQKSSSQRKFAVKHMDERVHGGARDIKPGYSNEAMEKGQMREPEGVGRFEAAFGLTTRKVGFCLTDDRRFGCSPDALVYDGESLAGGLEVKNYSAVEHFEWMDAGTLPNEFKNQVNGCMIVTGLKTWWWMNNCPPYEPIFIRTDWNEYTDKLAAALDEYDREVFQPLLAKVRQNRIIAMDIDRFDAEIESLIRQLGRAA